MTEPYERTLLSDVDMASYGADIDDLPAWVWTALLHQAKASYEAGENAAKLLLNALREGMP